MWFTGQVVHTCHGGWQDFSRRSWLWVKLVSAGIADALATLWPPTHLATWNLESNGGISLGFLRLNKHTWSLDMFFFKYLDMLKGKENGGYDGHIDMPKKRHFWPQRQTDRKSCRWISRALSGAAKLHGCWGWESRARCRKDQDFVTYFWISTNVVETNVIFTTHDWEWFIVYTNYWNGDDWGDGLLLFYPHYLYYLYYLYYLCLGILWPWNAPAKTVTQKLCQSLVITIFWARVPSGKLTVCYWKWP